MPQPDRSPDQAAYQHELDVALEVACEAAEILRRHWQGETESWEKSEDNPVTQADLESDRAIVARLRTAFPEDGLLSEETVRDPHHSERRRVWIVDPMDGTKEFIARIPEFGVSIALVEDGEPVVGVIVNPAARVAVFATRGGGSWRAALDAARPGGSLRAVAKRVAVSGRDHLDQALVIASRTEISRDQFAAYARLVSRDPSRGLDRLEARVHRLRRGRSQRLGRPQERVGRLRRRPAGARSRRRLLRLRRHRDVATTSRIR